jgi:hypothetical protein
LFVFLWCKNICVGCSFECSRISKFEFGRIGEIDLFGQ